MVLNMSRAPIKKTNNDLNLLKDKIDLRLNNLPDKKEINVLDLYAGEGVLWSAVKKRTDKRINVLSVDKKPYENIDLIGDNMKYLSEMDVSKFDIIDLDCYGICTKQMETIAAKNYKEIIHTTMIQLMYFTMANSVLYANGYSYEMIQKVPTLFGRDGLNKYLRYLNSLFGITKFKVATNIALNKKHYICFNTK